RFVDYKFEGEFNRAAERLAGLLGPDGGSSPASGERPAIVVVGGGISGVELAGELGRLGRVRPAGWKAPRVTLIHAGARLLPGLCERAGRKAEQHLRAQGVELRLNARLTRVSPGAATLRPCAAGAAAEDVPCDMAF